VLKCLSADWLAFNSDLDLDSTHICSTLAWRQQDGALWIDRHGVYSWMWLRPRDTLQTERETSKWMHWWATLRRHSDLFWAATSASSQVIPILNKSLLTVLLQFVRGRPRPLLNPETSQCNACQGMRWWSIRITCPSQRSLLSLSMSSILCCPVLTLTFSFVTLSFQEMPKMLLCHLWWAAFSFFVTVAVRRHTSALYSREGL